MGDPGAGGPGAPSPVTRFAPVTRLAVVDDLPYYTEALLPHLRRHRIVVVA
ncbi:MAG: hypothetical protein QG608_1187, partial [Actinomycetota bacterium]|nr:hypothetical protein [Actinomycetota bacterium]